MADALKPCPFCGGGAVVVVTDAEGNPRDDEYEGNPWSGLGYMLRHSIDFNPQCPIANEEDGCLGCIIHESREDAAAAWNNRHDPSNLPTCNPSERPLR